MPDNPRKVRLVRNPANMMQRSSRVADGPVGRMDTILRWLSQRCEVSVASFITSGAAEPATKIPRWAAWFLAYNVYRIRITAIETYFGVNRRAIYWALETVADRLIDKEKYQENRGEMDYVMSLIREYPFENKKTIEDAIARMVADRAKKLAVDL